MPKFIIYATKTIEYEVPIEADDENDAYDEIYEWISDDFDAYQTNASWEFQAVEK